MAVTYFQDTIFFTDTSLSAPGDGTVLQVASNNFFATKEMQPSVMNNLKSMFVRSNLSQQELGTLNGIISAIEKKLLTNGKS